VKRIYGTVQERLWSRADKSLPGCWEWPGCRDKWGYGRLKNSRGAKTGAHQIAWESERGPIPPGKDVLHRCDNPPCFRPDHLFLGNDTDNANDRTTKLRGHQGEAHRRARLSLSQVLELRKLYALGIGIADLSRNYGVARTTIHAAVTRRTWKYAERQVGGIVPGWLP